MVLLDLGPIGGDYKDIQIAAPTGATLELAKDNNGADEITLGDDSGFQRVLSSGDTDFAGAKKNWQKTSPT